MPQRFCERTVIVTGAGSGIGRQAAIAFAFEGAKVIAADIDTEKLASIILEITAIGGVAQDIHVDVSDENSVAHLFQKAWDTFGPVSVLVNNVGIEISGGLQDFSISDYDRLFAVNTRSVFLCTRAALPHMRKLGRGSVVNLASVASFRTWPCDGAYSASKAAVLALTKAFAIDLANEGIRVNAVAPAIIDTPMTDRAIADEADKVGAKQRKGLIHPLGRLGTPTEVANAILFLASEDASFTTGGCITVDGGLLA